jgi:hypothetical protein
MGWLQRGHVLDGSEIESALPGFFLDLIFA